jgi:hypothetical protein
MPITNKRPSCTGCSKPLEPDWRLCPYCGVRVSRPIRPASTATTWQLWRRYQYHVRDSLLPFLRSLAAAKSGSLEVKVEAWRPGRYAEALALARRRLVELGQDTRLPSEFRLALTVFGKSRDHEAQIAQALTLAITEVQAAVQVLIDAGDINASALQGVVGYLERRDQASTFAQVGAAVTGLDSGLLRIAAHVFTSWLSTSRSNARQQRWERACLDLAAAGDRLIERGWDDLVRRTQAAGLRLREAQDLRQLEAEADACWRSLVEQQDGNDGKFEQTHTRIHALAGQHPHAYPVEQLRKHADLLAEVRAQLVGHWISRVCIGINADSLERAQQHFLRLLPGDGVLAFFATTVFGQGKAGLALTTSSVQWLGNDQVPHRFGYAELRATTMTWTDEHVVVGGERIGELTARDAEAAGRALMACVRLSLAAPGPAVCPCGAPGHWLMFGADEARCPGCGGAVHYA